MAHVYTTARGKTKKSKETQRKDAKNNAANKLMSNIAKAPTRAQAHVPQDLDFLNKLRGDVNGTKTIEGSAKAKLFKQRVQTADGSEFVSDEALERAIRKVREQLPSYHRCFYFLCASPSAESVYKHCSRCRIARYCSPDCQKLDWTRTHKQTCGKYDSIVIGSSVAIRPLDSYLALLPPSLYPTHTCKPPCNELHGVVTSLTTPSPSTDSPTPTPSVQIEIFDSHLIPGNMSIEVGGGDVVVSGWDLEAERGLAGEKQRALEETRKRAEDRKVLLEEEERVRQERRRVKAAKAHELMEKKKKEMEQKPGSVAVDWSLFESEVLEELEQLEADEGEDSTE